MEENRTKKNNSTKVKLYVIVAVLTIGSVAFRLIGKYHFEQTSILFVGLPALITLLMIKYSGTPKSAYGVVFKVITLFLLMSSILLGEGVICVLFAAPIFYGVSALIVFIYEYSKKKKSKLYSIAIIPIILLVAQPFGLKNSPELQTVKSSIIINQNVSIDEIKNSPDFTNNYPTFFKMGFPKPLDVKGEGITIGDTREISFESSTKGIGTLTLKIIERDEESITFNVVNDDTHINHWLTWKEVEVEVHSINQTQTEVVWISKYTCDLGPQWYFEPLEKYAVKMMNEHLIASYFN